MAFGKRKRPPKKKVVDRSKHAKVYAQSWSIRNAWKGWGYVKPKK